MTKPGAARIAIIGTVGVPASYGGFETLVENLLSFNAAEGGGRALTVYCSGPAYADRPTHFKEARLAYVPIKANGAQSVPYDIWSMLSALRNGADTLLVLGVSGAVALPLIRRFSEARIVINIDGMEWRREKWGPLQRWFLKLSESLAVRYSDAVIADNGAITEYVAREYHLRPETIAYGGDHALAVASAPLNEVNLPTRYAFNLCRIEPENNVAMMLEAFAAQKLPDPLPFICVGNWDRSAYGRDLKRRYGSHPNVYILDPIYDLGKLRTLRENATVYVHGHAAGGTNPSLVEAMQFGMPVLAFDCPFNRHTTENNALFFANSGDLTALLCDVNDNNPKMAHVGSAMRRLAAERYSWDGIARAYFALLDR